MAANKKARQIEKKLEEEWQPHFPLPNELHEMFARQMLRVRSVASAFQVAYWQIMDQDPPTDPRWAGFKLLRNPEIHQRIAYLREQLYMEMKVTAQSVAAELDQAVEMAAELGDPDVMIKGLVAKARVMGLDQIKDPNNSAPPLTSVTVNIVDRSKRAEAEPDVGN